MRYIIFILVLCLSFALSGCNDDSSKNNLPGGTVRRGEQNATVKPEETKPVKPKAPDNSLPGGSVRRSQ